MNNETHPTAAELLETYDGLSNEARAQWAVDLSDRDFALWYRAMGERRRAMFAPKTPEALLAQHDSLSGDALGLWAAGLSTADFSTLARALGARALHIPEQDDTEKHQ